MFAPDKGLLYTASGSAGGMAHMVTASGKIYAVADGVGEENVQENRQWFFEPTRRAVLTTAVYGACRRLEP
jgi:hypothetical protein